MKRLIAILVLCALGSTLLAEPTTKYVCAIYGPDSTYLTEFATHDECEAKCFQEGNPAVCEETEISNPVKESNLD